MRVVSVCWIATALLESGLWETFLRLDCLRLLLVSLGVIFRFKARKAASFADYQGIGDKS
jgi:hypothetical protein